MEVIEVGLTESEKDSLNRDRNQNQARAIEAASSAADSSSPQSAELTAPSSTPDATSPKEVSSILENVVNPLLKRGGVAPLDADELRRGGEALAPALNRYVPWLMTTHPELVSAGMFLGGVTFVRVMDARDKRRAREEAAKRAAASPAPPAAEPAKVAA